ncbi:MAG: YbhB/YbcL family Raf kinase inhibitor-like protein [Lautropia sp.]
MLEKLPPTLGHGLRDTRAGLEHVLFNRIDLRGGTGAIAVRSLAFADHAPIPALYTADGDGVSPPIEWTGVPSTAVALVLVVEDADSPTPMPLVHAIVTDLAAGDGQLAEGAIDKASDAAQDATIGRNSYLRRGWLPPDPPPGHGVHRYAFQLFALGPGDDLGSVPGREAVLALLEARAIASGMLIGTYARGDGTLPVRDSRAAVAGP